MESTETLLHRGRTCNTVAVIPYLNYTDHLCVFTLNTPVLLIDLQRLMGSTQRTLSATTT